MNNLIIKYLVIVAVIFSINTSQAMTVNLALSSDKDPLNLSVGDDITFTVGFLEEAVMLGYGLGIHYDRTELRFKSAEQLVSFVHPFFGAFKAPFEGSPQDTPTRNRDDSKGLRDSESGHATLFQFGESEPTKNLFSLTFTVLDIFSDGEKDLEVGFFDSTTDGVTQAFGAPLFTVGQSIVTAEISSVPVPAAVWLFGSSLIGLMVTTKRKKA